MHSFPKCCACVMWFRKALPITHFLTALMFKFLGTFVALIDRENTSVASFYLTYSHFLLMLLQMLSTLELKACSPQFLWFNFLIYQSSTALPANLKLAEINLLALRIRTLKYLKRQEFFLSFFAFNALLLCFTTIAHSR